MIKLKHIPVYFFVLFASLAVNAQTIRRLSLQEVLMSLQAKNLTDSQRAEKYLDLSFHYQYKQTDSSFYYAKLSEKIAIEHNYATIAAVAKRQLGINYFLSANYRVAEAYLMQSYKQATENKLSLLQYNLCNDLSHFYIVQQQWNTAIDYAKAAESKLLQNANNPDYEKENNKLVFAAIHLAAGQQENALTICKTVVSNFQKANNTVGIMEAYILISKIFAAQNKIDDAKTFLLKALNLSNEAGMPLLNAAIFNSLGEICFTQNDFTNALDFHKKAAAIYQNMSMSFAWQEQQANIANILFIKGDVWNAKQMATIALSKMTDAGNNIKRATLLKLLIEIETNAGNANKALHYSNEYMAIVDSLQSTDHLHTLLTEKSISRGPSIKKDEADSYSNNADENPLTIYFISGVLIVLTLILLGYMFNQKNKAIEALFHQQEQNEGKKKELELLNMDAVAKNEELARINKLKDQLLSMVAHDIRSPLNALQSTLALTQDETLTKDEFRTLTHALESDLFNLRDMLDNMLLWAREQVVEVKITKASFDLYLLTKNIFKLYEHSFQSKNIQLHNFLLPGLMVYADQEAVATIFRNLLSNALKFTPADKNIYIQYVSLSGKIYLSVKDEGIGIDADTLQKIKSGVHFSNRGTNNEKGTGIGLLFCQELAQRMDESFDISSDQQYGTSVTISLSTINS